MPSVSKKQQAFMGMVDQYKKTGQLPDYSEEMKDKIRDAADSMTDEQVHDFAATDTKDLSEKVAATMEQAVESHTPVVFFRPDIEEKIKKEIDAGGDPMTVLNKYKKQGTMVHPTKKAEYIFNKLSTVSILSPEQELENKKVRAQVALSHNATPAIIGTGVLGGMIGAAHTISEPIKRIGKATAIGTAIGAGIGTTLKLVSDAKAKKVLNPANDEENLKAIDAKRTKLTH